MTLKKRINRLLKSGKTQAEVAEMLSVSQPTVSRLRDREAEPLVRLTKHEKAALLRLFKLHRGPDFQHAWSPLDVQQVMFALRRVTGVDLDC